MDEKTQEEVSLEEQVILFITVNTSPQGLISVPAPCQYARKLTFLVAQSIHKEPSLELANSLFYLWWHKALTSLEEGSEEHLVCFVQIHQELEAVTGRRFLVLNNFWGKKKKQNPKTLI